MPQAIATQNHLSLNQRSHTIGNFKELIGDPTPTWEDSIDALLNPLPKRPYSCPLSNGCTVVRPFQIGEHDWESAHRGVDLKVASDLTVYAPDDGIVSFVGEINFRPVLSITHESGIRTTYEPVYSELPVGTEVKRSDPIGSVLIGHCSMRICLHWGAKTAANAYINPIFLLEPQVIRLLK
ncbi:M23 family metallopeptidase [Arcanobacterium bovis]|nr:M23 family metallopeptidase [Arcanobacterium bovis]